ncbi:hypothetical protein OS493_039547, partial [Desmophyllum pertusum]
ANRQTELACNLLQYVSITGKWLDHMFLSYADKYFVKLCDYKSHQICCEKALEIKREIYGRKIHDDVATSYNNLGLVYRNIGQHEQAKNFTRRHSISE